MTTNSFSPWRALFFLAGLLILIGGPMHPGGSMVQMLGDPRWVPGHTLVTLGFAALLAALVLLARADTAPEGTRRWLRFAIVGTALQTVEMVVHTAAAVDHGNLVAGHATPVLSTHLALAALFYPVFGIALIGFIVAAARHRTAGAWWIAPIGIVGAAAHGASAPLVILTGNERLRILFPLLALFALWMVLAALWPARGPAGATLPARTAPLPSGR